MKYLLERYHISLSKSVVYIKITVIIFFFFFSSHSNAQKISSQVFNGWGGSVLLNGKTFDGSVGEASIITLKAGGYTITQGFLQPIDLELPCGEIQLKAFPNPVIGEMRIYAEGCDVEVISVLAYDLFGKLVYEDKPAENMVNLSEIGVGVYMVRAFDASNKLLGVVKVIKTTI